MLLYIGTGHWREFSTKNYRTIGDISYISMARQCGNNYWTEAVTSPNDGECCFLLDINPIFSIFIAYNVDRWQQIERLSWVNVGHISLTIEDKRIIDEAIRDYMETGI